MKLAIAICISTLAVAMAQQPPTSPCEFDGFDTNSKLAETIKTGDPAVVGRVAGEWTCAYAVTRKGSGQSWIRSKEIRLLDADPKPAPAAWIGTWAQGNNRIRIKSSGAPDKLSLEGEAYWHGFGDNVHSGEFSSEASPVGNHLHLEDDACKIDLALIGKYILANDNNMCGGMNVRFWSVWKRR